MGGRANRQTAKTAKKHRNPPKPLKLAVIGGISVLLAMLASPDLANAFVGQGKYDEAMAVGELRPAEPWVVAAMMLRSMLREGPPRPDKQTGALGSGPPPVMRACIGFDAAAKRVLARDHAEALAHWEARRPRLLEIHRSLGGDEEALAHRPDVVSVVQAMWDERTAALRASSCKRDVIGAAVVRVCRILHRLGQRNTEVYSMMKPTLSAAATLGDQASALREMQSDMNNVAETAAARVNTQTRRVLDLDDDTRSVVVRKWLEEVSR